MKHFFIAIFLLACQGGFCQDANIDSLISQLSDTEIRGECNYNWVVKLNSKAGNMLERIGKPATKKLLSALTDSARGIAAHYVLTRIYKPNEANLQLWAWAEKDNLNVYKFNGLLFFESQNGTYTSRNELMSNLSNWKSYLNNR
jgi:hypothetical protein